MNKYYEETIRQNHELNLNFLGMHIKKLIK